MPSGATTSGAGSASVTWVPWPGVDQHVDAPAREQHPLGGRAQAEMQVGVAPLLHAPEVEADAVVLDDAGQPAGVA